MLEVITANTIEINDNILGVTKEFLIIFMF
jgi:hypothetical protein